MVEASYTIWKGQSKIARYLNIELKYFWCYDNDSEDTDSVFFKDYKQCMTLTVFS